MIENVSLTEGKGVELSTISPENPQELQIEHISARSSVLSFLSLSDHVHVLWISLHLKIELPARS